MNKYSNIQPAMTIKRFTEQAVPTSAPESDIAFYLNAVKRDVNQGYYVPMDVLKVLKEQPNRKELETALFAFINDKNAVVTEKYEQDKIEDTYEIEVIQIAKK